MSENNYDRDSCTAFFLNYRNCRDFWVNNIIHILFPPSNLKKLWTSGFHIGFICHVLYQPGSMTWSESMVFLTYYMYANMIAFLYKKSLHVLKNG